MSWACVAGGTIAAVGSIGGGMLNAKNQKEGLKSSQQVIMTPQQKMMLRQMTGITGATLAGQLTPGDVAASNAAQTESQLGLRDAVAAQEQQPGSAPMTPEMLAMLQGKALQSRVAGNIDVRDKGYDAARLAGLQIALNSKPQGSTGNKSGDGMGALGDALGGVAQGIGLMIPTKAKTTVSPTSTTSTLPGGTQNLALNDQTQALAAQLKLKYPEGSY